MILHKHHIVHRHAGGTDNPSNIVELTIEDHAIAHKVLYGLYGRWQDKLAYESLLGLKDGGLIQLEAVKLANTGKKLSEEHKQKIRSYRHTEQARLNIKKNHAFKNGRPGHSERMSGDKNPGIVYKGKSWKKDPTTGKRIWIGV